MANRNGPATLPGKARVLHVLPKTITYTVDSDAETLALAGYIKGPSCPVPVSIEIERAWAEWEAGQPSVEERDAMNPHAYLATMNAAERILRRDLLMAAIPGLDADQANVLAADGGEWESILGELGWWGVAEDMDEDPEVTAPAVSEPTGASSSQEPAPPTQASIS